jgi:hypothetical protein
MFKAKSAREHTISEGRLSIIRASRLDSIGEKEAREVPDGPSTCAVPALVEAVWLWLCLPEGTKACGDHLLIGDGGHQEA